MISKGMPYQLESKRASW